MNVKNLLIAAISFLSSTASMAEDTPVQPDLSEVRFLGHCAPLTTDDIEYNASTGLHINLENISSTNAIFQMRECTIRVPYDTNGLDISGDVSLLGSYAVSNHEQLMITLDAFKAGTLPDATVLYIKNSIDGSFELSDPFKIKGEPDTDLTLNILITMMLIPNSSEKDKDNEETPVQLTGSLSRLTVKLAW